MKTLSTMMMVFFVSTSAHAFGTSIIKKEFKCSIEADYSVYIAKTTGMTNSYAVKAFCLDLNDDGLESCLQDEDDDTYTCFEEFNSLNTLPSGDGELVINQGR
jgi:hypothetical protein